MCHPGDGRKTEQREVDVVALRADRSVAAMGMCKWTNEPMGEAELALLRRLEAHVTGGAGAGMLYLFSRSGFARELAREERRSQLRLVEAADLGG